MPTSAGLPTLHITVITMSYQSGQNIRSLTKIAMLLLFSKLILPATKEQCGQTRAGAWALTGLSSHLSFIFVLWLGAGYFRCTYKTSQNKTSQGTKRLKGHNVPGDTTSQGQNVSETKRPNGQSVPRGKTSQGDKWGPLFNMVWPIT